MREDLQLAGEVPLDDSDIDAWSAKINSWIEEARHAQNRASAVVPRDS